MNHLFNDKECCVLLNCKVALHCFQIQIRWFFCLIFMFNLFVRTIAIFPLIYSLFCRQLNCNAFVLFSVLNIGYGTHLLEFKITYFESRISIAIELLLMCEKKTHHLALTVNVICLIFTRLSAYWIWLHPNMA